MIDQIEISEQDEHSFSFPNFEFVYYKGDSYILDNLGYFPINSISSFLPHPEGYILKNEDGDILIIIEEDFIKLKGIFGKYD